MSYPSAKRDHCRTMNEQTLLKLKTILCNIFRTAFPILLYVVDGIYKGNAEKDEHRTTFQRMQLYLLSAYSGGTIRKNG